MTSDSIVFPYTFSTPLQSQTFTYDLTSLLRTTFGGNTENIGARYKATGAKIRGIYFEGYLYTEIYKEHKASLYEGSKYGRFRAYKKLPMVC